MSHSVEPSFDTLTLERLKFGIQGRVGASVAESLEVHTWQDKVFSDLVYKVTGYVLAERLPAENLNVTKFWSYEVPANWFQHLKHTCYRWRRLGWFRERWPVRVAKVEKTAMVTVSMERYRTFPEASYVFPKDLGRPVNIVIPKPINWRWTGDA
jgi:hypothetical protein